MIKFKKGYKYQLVEEYKIKTIILPEFDIITEYINLTKEGELTILKGYCWDGPSGPTFDTKNFMRGSLVHDALYQLLREEKLHEFRKSKADKLLRKICIEDGMSRIRAYYVYKVVESVAGFATSPKRRKAVLIAP